MIYMTFLGVSWACFLFFFLYKRPQKHPPRKSYRSYFRRAQIRWVIWRSSILRYRVGVLPMHVGSSWRQEICGGDDDKAESLAGTLHERLAPAEAQKPKSVAAAAHGFREFSSRREVLHGVGAECTKLARFSAAAAPIFTAPQNIARFFEVPRWAISSAKKTASEPRFLLRRQWSAGH